ncbi:MAG: hypothetical protein JSW38_01240 [Dehalococcoidia bacterium]|nr:MAG: hypothetical protein JSW38_01240 [Dehalococcoidia bacterium]
MALFERVVLKDTVEINTTPDRVWEFWVNMDKNYRSWHPQDHVLFRWTRGKPMEEGSKKYAEETVGGKLLKLKVVCMDVVPKRKFTLALPFPQSLFARYEYLIEPRGAKTAFTYLKYPGFARRGIESAADVGKKHVKEEGENLKTILEGEKP